jgi:hypothetical protein
LYVSSVALFLATLTRPEGLLVLVTLLGLGGMMWAQEARNRPRDLLFPLLVYCIPLSIYAIWRFEYFGSLLPNTFYAKTGGTVYQYLRGLRYSAYFGLYFLLPLLPVFGLYWLGSGRPRPGRRLSVRLMTLHVADHVGMYTCLLVCFTYTLYIIYVGGDYMAMDRFFVPLLPLIYTVVGFVTHSVLTSMPDSRGQRAIAAGFLMLAVAATLIQSTPFEKKLFPPPAWQHGNYRGVQAERYHSARLAVIGRFFDDYKRDGSDSLATGTIGAVAYYSNMRIYDFYGLVDPHIAHLKRKRLGRGFPGHEKWDLLHVLSKKPTYVMFSRQLTRAAAPDPDYSYLITQHDRAEIDKIIQEDYRLISVWLVDRENSQAGYFTFLELKARDRVCE